MNNFDIYKLDELTHHITDGEHGSVKDDANSNYYLLSNKNIVNGQVIINDNDRKIAFETFKKINKRTKLEIGDVVISTVGVLGKTAIIKNKINFDFQRSVGIIKVNSNLLDNRYLYYYLNLDFVRKRINDLSKGAVQKCFFISDLKNLEIHLPKNIKSQQKIAKVLSDIDAKIELNNKINAELEAMAKTLYDYWFVQFDFPNEDGKPYKSSGGKMVRNEELKREIPEGWEVKELEEIAKCIMGQSPKGESYNFDKIGVPLLNGPADYENGVLKGRTYTTEPTRLCQKDDLVLCIRATIGNLVYSEQEFCLGRGVAAVRPIDKNFSELIYFLLLQEIERFKIHATGSIIVGITKDDLIKSKCLIPNENVLNAFHKLIKPQFNKIRANLKENQELASLRDWLLPMLMNGQVSVGDVEEQLSMVAEGKENYKRS